MKVKKALFFGLGSIGQRHLRNLKQLRKKIDLYAFQRLDKSPLLNSKNIKIKGNVNKYHNIKNLNSLKNESFDVIFITNPSSHHLNSILKLKNQKNSYIFIEKPIDVNLIKINQLNKILKKNNLKTFVACNLRFTKSYNNFRNLIRQKKLGKINYVMIKSSLNIREFHNYENYRNSYTSIKKLGGGINFTSIHEIDLLENLFDSSKIIFSLTDKISKLKINVDDFSNTIFRSKIMNNSFFTILTMDHFQINKERYIKVIFDNGEIIWNILENKITILNKNSRKIIKSKENHNDMYIKQLKFFLDKVENKKNISNNFNHKNGIKCLKTALNISNKKF